MMVPSQQSVRDWQNELLNRQPHPRHVEPYRRIEEEEIEEIEQSILVDINSIRSQVQPLCVNDRPLSSLNQNPIPGVLSYSQAMELEQTMAGPNPSEDDLRASKEFTLYNLGEGVKYGLSKFCKGFRIMTNGRCRTDPKTGQHIYASTPKYSDAVKGAFTVETQESGSGGVASSSSAPAFFGERGFVTRSIGYCHSIIQTISPLLEKIRLLLEQMSCLR
jgi:hypothetical protein